MLTRWRRSCGAGRLRDLIYVKAIDGTRPTLAPMDKRPAVDIGSILIHLDVAPASIGRLALARGLADRFGAQMTVLFGGGAEATQPAFAYSAAAALRAAEEVRGTHDLARARLQDLQAEHGGDTLWCDVGSDLVPALLAEAAYADLLILGPPHELGDVDIARPGHVESVILRAGVPTLVVPHPHRQDTVGDRALIAWDGSVHAARAIRAALPFLRGATEVHVATWSRQPTLAPASRIGVVEWLKRHRIHARTHQRGPTSRVGEALGQLARELRADLIVMGCYSHGPLRERMFGGATRSILTSLPAPVLMAH
jgi:nucleotide-binding universal stress UspA family protein